MSAVLPPFASDPGSEPHWQRTGWAGALSFLLHLMLMLLGSWFLRGALPTVPTEAARSVGVVLVTTNEAQRETYYQESSAESVANHAESAAAASAPAALAETLPAVNPLVKLPGPEQARELLQVDAVPNRLLGGAGTRPVIDADSDFAAVMEEESKRVKKSGPVGPQAKLSVFGSPAASGHSFVFLIDRSQSMGADGLNVLSAAESELLTAVEKLRENHRFQIIAYNETPKFLSERKLLTATPEQLAAAKTFLQTLTAYGPTDHTLALTSALRLQPDVLFLFTDGDDPYVGLRQRERLHALAGHTQIHCVQFGWQKPVDETSRECLESLARENRGTYSFVDMSKRTSR